MAKQKVKERCRASLFKWGVDTVLNFWAGEWGVDVSRLTYIDDRGGEIWLDGKPEILDMASGKDV